MDSFEINKIIAAVLVTVLLVFGIGKISDILFHVNKPDVKGYKVEINTKATNQINTESQVDISALLTLGNAEHGAKVFKKCAACHSVNKNGKNKIGPALWGVMMRPVGSIADYKYSKALSSYNKEWSWEEMNGFLTKPSKWITGNKMGFAGLKSEKDRSSVMLYLNKNSDNPKPLP
ncbi:cytochrome c family protein [Candidatus Pelagibacter sp.]|nr:cytochrome c family protein [Candidatus Pelagibacter sp.]